MLLEAALRQGSGLWASACEAPSAQGKAGAPHPGAAGATVGVWSGEEVPGGHQRCQVATCCVAGGEKGQLP